MSSTVVIKVNLSCSHCSRKIKRALCVLQEQFNIASITFDEKNNTILVSGPFDADCFIKKICCLARRVIKDISIKKPPPSPPITPPPPPPPPPPPQPQPVEVVVKFPDCCPPPVFPVCCNQPWPVPPPVCTGSCNQPCPVPPPECSVCCMQPWPCVEPRPGGGRRCSCGPGERPPHGCRPPLLEPECFKIVCENDPSYGCSIM